MKRLWVYVDDILRERFMLYHTLKYYVREALVPALFAGIAGLFCWLAFNVKDDALISFALVVFVVAMVRFALRFADVIYVFRYNAKCNAKVDAAENKKGIIVISGGNRTGKSLDGTQMLLYKADCLWVDVMRRVLVLRRLKSKRKLTQAEFREYKEINQTYKFYQRNPHLIPLLVTNVKIIDGHGRSSMETLAGHLVGEKKLPHPCVVGIDESRFKIDNHIFRDESSTACIIEILRFLNQIHGDASLLIFMEQNHERAFLGLRDSAHEYKTQHGVELLLKPKRLIKRRDKLWKRFDIGKERLDFHFASTIDQLDKDINRIGVLVLNFSSSVEKNGKVTKEYLPCDMRARYDNRFFRTVDVCQCDDIALSEFKGDVMHHMMLGDQIKMGKTNDDRYGALCHGRIVADIYNERKARVATKLGAKNKRDKGAKKLK